MKYDLVLFDIDDTLFDFSRSQADAFFSVMDFLGIEKAEQRLDQFRAINVKLWKRFEQGLIPKDSIRAERFRIYAEERRLSFDPHQAANDFLEKLCEVTHLIRDAQSVCDALRGKVNMGVITNGIATVQHRRIAQSTLASHFDFVVVSEECGYQKPMPEIFDFALKQYGHLDRQKILMVGDRLDTDIQGASLSGIHSCWFNPDQVKHTGVYYPNYSIAKLKELLEI